MLLIRVSLHKMDWSVRQCFTDPSSSVLFLLQGLPITTLTRRVPGYHATRTIQYNPRIAQPNFSFCENKTFSFVLSVEITPRTSGWACHAVSSVGSETRFLYLRNPEARGAIARNKSSRISMTADRSKIGVTTPHLDVTTPQVPKFRPDPVFSVIPPY